MATLAPRPRFDTDQASSFARQYFSLEATSRELTSERDQNFLLCDAAGNRHVLKLFNALERRAVLDLQNAILRRLADHPCEYAFPEPVPGANGNDLIEIDAAGERYQACLLTWVDGLPMATVRPRSRRLARQLGDLLGHVSTALEGLEHEAADRSLKWSLLSAQQIFEATLPLIPAGEARDRVENLRSHFADRVDAVLPRLRSSVIHNDSNDHNVIVGSLEEIDGWPQRRVAGLIDVGDALRAPTVGELAVGLTYAMLDRDDPLEIARDVVGGYHAVFPLHEAEVDVLFDLVLMRICLSVCNAAQQHDAEPDNEYLLISQRAAEAALTQLGSIDRNLATCHLRHACGWEPSAAGAELRRWLTGKHGGFAAVVAPGVDPSAVELLDLSVGSTAMGGGAPGTFDAAALSERIGAVLRRADATLGYGGYDETRCWYGGDLFAAPANEAPRRRTVHLGVDLFASPGAPVYAPLAGTVASARINAGRLNYGPTIILQHDPEDGPRFYTLYGHLTEDSVTELERGSAVEVGAQIGAIGDFPNNGDWPPHLHFQVVADPLGNEGDFPGVSTPAEREIYKSLSPDPSLILDLPARLSNEPQQAQAEIMRRRTEHLGPSLSVAYRRPLTIVRGFRQFLYDVDGQPFLDAVNNVPHVGHSHPRVVAAAAQQNAVLNTNTRYLHDNIVRYAERLTETLPEPLQVCFFVCTGSEANELALRLARAHTGRRDVVTLDGAYHGNTSQLVDLSPYKHDGPGGSGPPPWVHVACMPDLYRGPYKSTDDDAASRYADDVARCCAQSDGIAAFIAEPLLGCGGQVVPPDGYLSRAFEHVRAAGGVCIADEVQVGFGRVGSHFWAFDAMGAVPDIVTLGKPIGNGYPLAAVITTHAIADSFANGMEYFNTFGGNPVAAAIGTAVLDVIEEEGLQANARVVGEHLLDGLRSLLPRHELIGDVRGLGLYLGAELVRDPHTLEPAADEASYVINRLRDHGILMSTDGPLHNVLKIKPPLCFSAADADRLLETLDRIFDEDALKDGRKTGR